METSIETREEGGNNQYVHQFPTRLKYTPVKLSRPINYDSALVAHWFMQVVKLRPTNRTAVIQACGGPNEHMVIAEWSLQNVVPVRWTGPSFSVENPKVATETLELMFHGFLPPVARKGF
jgi:phage tail-like protein